MCDLVGFEIISPSRMVNSYSESVSESDEEHRLIAR